MFISRLSLFCNGYYKLCLYRWHLKTITLIMVISWLSSKQQLNTLLKSVLTSLMYIDCVLGYLLFYVMSMELGLALLVGSDTPNKVYPRTK